MEVGLTSKSSNYPSLLRISSIKYLIKFVDYSRRECPIETLVQDAIEISAAAARVRVGHLVVL
jgi:hypothetical protein